MTGYVPQVLEQNFTVQYRYPVYFCHDVFGAESLILSQFLSGARAGLNRVAVVVDDGVVGHHPNLFEKIASKASHDGQWELMGEPLVVPGGERIKNEPQAVERITSHFEQLGLDRHCYVFGIGGGAVLDAVGYSAAIVHRGVGLIRFPTTVLSQNDSGVGVKNGVNRYGTKNFLGTFTPPSAVVADFDFLETLSQRDFISGIAEAVKVSLIKDAPLFEWLEEHTGALVAREPKAVAYMIARTAELHLLHIGEGGDPFESGSKRPLDFGHWVAHKLESMTNNEVRHGEAVAIGIALDVLYSHHVCGLSAGELKRVLALLRCLGLPNYHPALEEKDEAGRARYISGLEEFRQHLGGRLNVTLLNRIGSSVQATELDSELIEVCRKELAAESGSS